MFQFFNELGHFLIALSLAASLVVIFLYYTNAPIRVSQYFLNISSVAISVSLLLLIYAFYRVDLSVLIVYNNSHIFKPLLYRISATWSNHEGSLLLWGCFFVVSLSVGLQFCPEKLKKDFALIAAILITAVLIFIIYFSNPWVRLDYPVIDGSGLNPLLQDPFLAIHPPLLYLGYTGLTVPFCIVTAALLQKGDKQKLPHKILRSWALWSCITLTLGIGLGAYWAWRELGFGGFWFWDPVENSSLLPWIATIALLHSLIIVAKKGSMQNWSIFLSITAFTLSILGMFLVRSGILDSVHAFASDLRGVYILVMLLVLSICGYLLMSFYSYKFATKDDNNFEILSKEGLIIISNWLLFTCAFSILIGTLYPLVISSISIGKDFYNLVLAPFAAILIFLLGSAPLFYKHGFAKKSFVISILIAISLAIILVVIYFDSTYATSRYIKLAIGSFFAIYALTASILMPKGDVYPLSFLQNMGIRLAHIGVALAAFGIITSAYLKIERTYVLQEGKSYELGKYELVFTGFSITENNDYSAEILNFDILVDDKPVSKIKTSKRTFWIENDTAVEIGIISTLLEDIYIGYDQVLKEGPRSAKFYLLPFISWLWIGFIFMNLGMIMCFVVAILNLRRAKNNG